MRTSFRLVSLNRFVMPWKAFPQMGRIGQVAVLSQAVGSERQSTKENLVSKRVSTLQMLIWSGALASICPPLGPLTLLIKSAFLELAFYCHNMENMHLSILKFYLEEKRNEKRRC